VIFSQGESELKKTEVDDFLGVWEAFREGTPPNVKKGEESSKLVIFRDSDKKIIIFFAGRSANRQVGFFFGIATFKRVSHFLCKRQVS